MYRANKLPLAGLAWTFAVVALLMFSMGYKAEAQGSGQQLEVQQTENNQEADQNQDSEQRQDQESRPEQNQQENQEQNNNNQPQQEQRQAENQGTYDYVAQDGDSYTLMARKAVQTHGLINDVNLSIAEIVYAETQLTKGAGYPELEVGQQVQFQVAEVDQAVKAAQDLSEQEEAMWDYYAQQVPSFNTDNVGEGSVQASTTENEESSQKQDDKDQASKQEQEVKSDSKEAQEDEVEDTAKDSEGGAVSGAVSEGGK